MKLSVALFFAGLFGALAAVFILLSFGTDYWLLASESCHTNPGRSVELGNVTIEVGVQAAGGSERGWAFVLCKLAISYQVVIGWNVFIFVILKTKVKSFVLAVRPEMRNNPSSSILLYNIKPLNVVLLSCILYPQNKVHISSNCGPLNENQSHFFCFGNCSCSKHSLSRESEVQGGEASLQDLFM